MSILKELNVIGKREEKQSLEIVIHVADFLLEYMVTVLCIFNSGLGI